MELAPHDLSVYRWGLELYQPKWLNRPQQLVEVVRKAAEAGQPWNFPAREEIAFQACVIANRTGQAGLIAAARPLIRSGAEQRELEADLRTQGG
jgi:hypothetical protein